MKPIRTIFCALVAVFVITVGTMFASPARDWLMPYGFFTALAVLLGLGIALIVLTVKKKVEGKLKGFLLLTGASAAGLPASGILHNVVSGLFGIEEAFFFTLATIVCPVAFLVGAVGTIILMMKNKPGIPEQTP